MAEAFGYPNPEIGRVLSRTLGVPIFQEQVTQLTIVTAGFTPGEADQLRRAMAAWKRRGGLKLFEQRLIKGMRERSYTQEFAEALFPQIQGFGEYGLSETHSASFARLAYVSAWIKCHEPAAFLAALLNSQPMGFYGPAQLVQDARRHGVDVPSVDGAGKPIRLHARTRRRERARGSTRPAHRQGIDSSGPGKDRDRADPAL
jgi:error-prone DNA polymerase